MEKDYLTRSSLLTKVPNLRHGFTRHTIPEALFRELNSNTATVKQVHGAEIAWTSDLKKAWVDADAVGTTNPNLPVGIYSADCAPILIASLNERGEAIAVMAVHAGWRGTAAKIAEIATESLWQTSPGKKLVAAIGPTIGFDSFEVGEEVVAAFPSSETHGLARFLREERGRRKFLFDLAGENARQIASAAARLNLHYEIDALGECTLQHKELYPSFRRDRENAGRMLSFLELTSKAC